MKGGKMKVQVIEDVGKDKTVWRVSFTSNNPARPESVDMASEEDAFRLQKILENDICVAFKPSLPFPLNQ